MNGSIVELAEMNFLRNYEGLYLTVHTGEERASRVGDEASPHHAFVSAE
jgi:hypothetical protein